MPGKVSPYPCANCIYRWKSFRSTKSV